MDEICPTQILEALAQNFVSSATFNRQNCAENMFKYVDGVGIADAEGCFLRMNVDMGQNIPQAAISEKLQLS